MGVDLSHQCKYGLLAMAYLARQEPGRLVPIQEIAGNVSVATPFLAKILSRLARNGILSTRRGPNGGVALANPASEVKLLEVVRIFEGVRDQHTCYLGLRECDGSNSCPVHEIWQRACDGLDRALVDQTLDDLRNIPLGDRPREGS